MNEKLILEPNYHSEVYRSLTTNLDVTVLENFLDFIEVSEDGHVLLGSSNLTGRSWYGSVWYYENVDLACKLTSYVANKSIQSGITDGKFLKDSSKVLIVDDSGIIQLMSLPDNGDSPDDKLQPQTSAEEHEGSITELCLLPHGNRFITSSTDCSIKLWDLEKTRYESNECFESIKTFGNAHRDTVTSVANNPLHDDIFVSCSTDREAFLWDLRLESKPAMGIYINNFCGLTNVKWHPLENNFVALSSEYSVVYLVDLRDPYQFLTTYQCFDRSIHRLKFNEKGMIAVCGDSNQFMVLNHKNNDLELVYEDHRHEDMIRGAAWTSDSTLLTCGWDRKIHKHELKLE